MKVCKFCHVECEDSATHCPSCSSVEFSNKCNNCGTIFDSGFCPNCGVKVGQKAKTCPKCKNEYFTAACPFCGYTVNSVVTQPQTVNVIHTHAAVPDVAVNTKAKKKKITIWTILLWILLLPVMLIITIWKSNKLNNVIKIVLTLIIVAICLGIGLSNRSSLTTNNRINNNTSINPEASVWTASETSIADFEYYIDESDVYLKRYNGSSDKVYIPSKYTVDGKEYNVVSLDETFTLRSVESVIISEGIKEVSANCFNSCGIEFLYIPKSLKDIPDYFWSYFHDMEKIYYAGSEEEFKEICKEERSEIQVKQIIFDAKISDLLGNVKTTAKTDYANAADFERALNNGEDLVGKTVTFTITIIEPDSSFGYNLVSGEHLNFCSGSNPGFSVGDTISVKVTKVKTFLGSYIINYETI